MQAIMLDEIRSILNRPTEMILPLPLYKTEGDIIIIEANSFRECPCDNKRVLGFANVILIHENLKYHINFLRLSVICPTVNDDIIDAGYCPVAVTPIDFAKRANTCGVGLRLVKMFPHNIAQFEIL